MPACEKCGAPAEDEIRVFDDTNGATVCDGCGHAIEPLVVTVRFTGLPLSTTSSP